MLAAIVAVKSGVAVKCAAEEHSVPPRTLRDRVSGRVAHGTKPGPRPHLSGKELELSSFLKTCTEVGYSKTRRDLLCIAQSVATNKGVLKGG